MALFVTCSCRISGSVSGFSHVSSTNTGRSRAAAQLLIRSASTQSRPPERASRHPTKKSGNRRDARRPRKRRTAHRRGRSDWPTTDACHLPHGANGCASERASKRRMRPAHVVPLAPMRPGCYGGARRPCARLRSRKQEACSDKSTLVHDHRQPRCTTHPARCSTS